MKIIYTKPTIAEIPVKTSFIGGFINDIFNNNVIDPNSKTI